MRSLLKGKKQKDPVLIVLEDSPIPVHERNPGVFEDLASVVDKAVKRNVKRRYQPAREFRIAKERAVATARRV